MRGFTLFYAVLVSSLLLAIGLAILNITFKEFVLSSGARDSETAFYAADTALECALYWDTTQHAFGFFGDSLAGGLIGYWRFEETEEQQNADDPIATDSSGSGEHAAVQGDAVWTTDGVIDQGLIFDGTNDTVDVEDITGLTTGNTPHTITAWIRIQALPPVRSWILVLGNRTAGAHHWLLNGPGNTEGYAPGTMQVGVWGGAQGRPVLTLLNEWTHIASVFDGSNLTVYVNGVDTSDTPVTASFNLAGIPFNLGRAQGAQNYFDGDIDDVRIYDRALDATEIAAIAGVESLAGFTPPLETEDEDVEPGTIMCAGDDINDSSGWWEYNETGDTGWYREDTSTGGDENWITRFDVSFSNGTCSRVEVFKDDTASTTIVSRGYNTCDLDNPRRLERAIRAHY